MAFTMHTGSERPALWERGISSASVWPEYSLHGDVLNRWWDGSDAALPGGIAAAIELIYSQVRAGEPCSTLCALAAESPREGRGRGLAEQLLRGMSAIGECQGLTHQVAPVRPSLKERYPLTAIERYVRWRRDDGQLFDPWMRIHERLGARVATPLPRSLRITGTVGEWETWTGMAFPESGDSVFPEGLAPVHIDRSTDRGSYWEPNVWMVHPELTLACLAPS
jgi:hypothetical protein